MAKIFKHADAPEGDLKVSVGPTHFKLADGESYETTDPAVIDAAETHPFLDIEYVESSVDPKGEMKAIRELRKEQDKVNKQRAEKDPLEPAAEMPVSVADLKSDDDKADKKETK